MRRRNLKKEKNNNKENMVETRTLSLKETYSCVGIRENN